MSATKPVRADIFLKKDCLFRVSDVHAFEKDQLIRVPSRVGDWYINPCNDEQNRFTVEINSYAKNMKALAERCVFTNALQETRAKRNLDNILSNAETVARC